MHSGIRPGPRPYLKDRLDSLNAMKWNRIGVTPLATTVGAEVSGVDLASPIDDETFDEIRRAHLAYRVIFFRDQSISDADHIAFAERFGELEEHPFLASTDDHDAIVRFEKSPEVVGVENLWHSDVSWREIPSLGSVLRAREVPPLGGDTLFADMVAAYECLDDATKEQITGLKAVHDFTQSFGMLLDKKALAEKQKEFPAVEHPVVRTIPETGEKTLYVNGVFTSHIAGMDRAESDALLQRLFREATTPEYQCRFSWQKGSIAFWDNRAVQHYAANDYWPQRRVMERATIIGERPV